MLNVRFVVVSTVILALGSVAVPSVTSQSWTESQGLVLFGLALYLVAAVTRFGKVRLRNPAQRPDGRPAAAGQALLADLATQ
jgi:hypothetical protein